MYILLSVNYNRHLSDLSLPLGKILWYTIARLN